MHVMAEAVAGASFGGTEMLQQAQGQEQRRTLKCRTRSLCLATFVVFHGCVGRSTVMLSHDDQVPIDHGCQRRPAEAMAMQLVHHLNEDVQETATCDWSPYEK